MSKNTIKIFMSLLLLSPFRSGYGEDLKYSLSVDQSMFKTYKVTIEVDGTSRNRLVFSMPIWIPGSYYVSKFGENVRNFRAVDVAGKPLRFQALSKNDWEVQLNGSFYTRIVYDIEPYEQSYMGTALDSLGAHVEGASTWMYVRGLEAEKIDVQLDPPQGWRVATALRAKRISFQYQAQNYDELADSPIMMGALRDTAFFIDKIPHEIYFRGEADSDQRAFVDMLEKIVRYQLKLFGGAPYDRYVFLYTLINEDYGASGLEHRNSTSIALPAIKIMADVKNAANISAHEFFHLWNVERLTSDQLYPMRYDREARLESLWWLEGITSYYADLTLVRAGIWSEEALLDNLEKEIKVLQENPDRLQTTLAEASWNIWERGYFTRGISYYNKGQLVGLLLDLTIRKVTNNEKSLDDVLLYLYEYYAKNARGFADAELEKSVKKVTGKDFGPFFDRYVTGLEELPFKDILKFAGWNVIISRNARPSMGRLRFYGAKNRVYSVDSDSPAARADLRRRDQIILADGQVIHSENDLAEIIKEKAIGDVLALLIDRNGAEVELLIVLEQEDRIDCTIAPMENMNGEQRRIRRGLLTGI